VSGHGLALEEVRHAALSIRHDLLLMVLSLNVILAECDEALNGPKATLIVIERSAR
jgi:hypothetical protein